MLRFSQVAEALTGLIYHRPSGENSKFIHSWTWGARKDLGPTLGAGHRMDTERPKAPQSSPDSRDTIAEPHTPHPPKNRPEDTPQCQPRNQVDPKEMD